MESSTFSKGNFGNSICKHKWPRIFSVLSKKCIYEVKIGWFGTHFPLKRGLVWCKKKSAQFPERMNLDLKHMALHWLHWYQVIQIFHNRTGPNCTQMIYIYLKSTYQYFWWKQITWTGHKIELKSINCKLSFCQDEGSLCTTKTETICGNFNNYPKSCTIQANRTKFSFPRSNFVKMYKIPKTIVVQTRSRNSSSSKYSSRWGGGGPPPPKVEHNKNHEK